jgi:hypothetical protein
LKGYLVEWFYNNQWGDEQKHIYGNIRVYTGLLREVVLWLVWKDSPNAPDGF